MIPFRPQLFRTILTVFLFLVLFESLLVAQVNYRLEGIVSVLDAKAKLTTEDGRIFKLVGIDFKDVAAFDQENCVIEGSVKESDQMEELRVKKITKKAIDAGKIVPPVYKPYERNLKLISEKDGVITVGDFRWRQIVASSTKGCEIHDFQTAQIKPDLVENVYIVLKPFPPKWLAAHSLFLFTFKDGGVVTPKGSTNGMCLSVEALMRKDQDFSLIGGLKNTFGNCWILTSYEDYMDEINYRGEELNLYPVVLDHNQTKQLVIESLRIGGVNRQGEYYNTITNNCTNNLIILMNRVLPESKRVDLWTIPHIIYNFKATAPVLLPKMLLKKGLIEDKNLKITAETARDPMTKLGLR
ncbi:MAG: DUF4105 domain-containing protein [Candidatus Riflebacteria bacterium]|nr:DUF4105 domain-containing protein [Candidatus Riflebacteria bacterium]